MTYYCCVWVITLRGSENQNERRSIHLKQGAPTGPSEDITVWSLNPRKSTSRRLLGLRPALRPQAHSCVGAMLRARRAPHSDGSKRSHSLRQRPRMAPSSGRPRWKQRWAQPPPGAPWLLPVTATHSSILAWTVPWTKKPGGQHFMGHNKSDMTE